MFGSRPNVALAPSVRWSELSLEGSETSATLPFPPIVSAMYWAEERPRPKLFDIAVVVTVVCGT